MRDGNPSQAGARHGREDAALIRRCQRGDQGAMNELIQAYQKHVFSLAFRLSNNYDDAQDIAQEAFIRVFNAIGNFRGDANFTTWIYRIVHNVFLDERKKQRVRDHSSLDEYLDLEDSSVARQIEDPSPGPEDAVEQRERHDVVVEAVMQLPENQRVMIALYHFQGRSYEEIAAIMQLPIGTVKSRLNRARLALKEKLGAARELLGA
jgi:RNA polymerase sigma-70 factor (ECF subfamily)